MAATTLGLLSPETNFDRMNMFAAEFGPIGGGGYSAGSLEMYAPDGLLPWTEWRGAVGKQIETGSGPDKSWHGQFSLVIMNPPFTRNSLRHDQFSKKDEEGIKKREAALFRNAPKGLRYSSDPMFIMLGKRLLGSSGTLAVVRPMSSASSSSSLAIRKFLAEHFHVETIVVSFDPKRIWFSENTDINELLLIARRTKKRSHTRIVKLAVNPSTEAEAIRCADALSKGETPTHATVQEWPTKYMKSGDWTVTQFYSRYLVETFMLLREGELFGTTRMGDVADENIDPRGARGLFVPTDSIPDGHPPWPTKWTHKTEHTTSMHAIPDQYLARNTKTKETMTDKKWRERASDALQRGGLLHITERVQIDQVRAFAIRTDHITVGSAWHSLVPKSGDGGLWSKAMATYVNSTLGIVGILGVRTFKKLPYPRWGVDNIRSIPVPVLDHKKIKILAATYDKLADADLGRLASPTSVRGELDVSVGSALGVPDGRIHVSRRELSREPMVTGRRYQSGTLD